MGGGTGVTEAGANAAAVLITIGLEDSLDAADVTGDGGVIFGCASGFGLGCAAAAGDTVPLEE